MPPNAPQSLSRALPLIIDIETREVSRYHLKVAKSGLKLKPATAPADPNTKYTSGVQNGLAHITFRNAPVSELLRAISTAASLGTAASSFRSTGSPNTLKTAGVVDETGLTGYYDGEFEFASSVSRTEFDESLDDALKRQLGLTLELKDAPGKVLVIRSSDHTPTEN